LIAYRRIRVSRICGKFATNGKSIVSEYELKTVWTIDSPEVNPIERLWGYLQEQLKWLRFEQIEELRESV
jgi:hypothetical protein